ncbi:MAG TPA: hypothetical protein VIY47_07010, partial [Ignavibacteriaceae bacterium]
MKKFLGGVLLTTSLFFVLFSYISYIDTDIREEETDDIKRIDIEYIDRKIYLNVELQRPIGCDEVKKILGINNILIKSRT